MSLTMLPTVNPYRLGATYPLALPETGKILPLSPREGAFVLRDVRMIGKSPPLLVPKLEKGEEGYGIPLIPIRQIEDDWVSIQSHTEQLP